MKTRVLFAFVAGASLFFVESCNRMSIDTPPSPDTSRKTAMTINASGEEMKKAFLDFEQTQNVRWSDSDLIAVFDGVSKNEFSIEGGSNTGAVAKFVGEAVSSNPLYCVYPFSAGNSQDGATLSVTVPSAQVVSSSASVDPAALVSVGQVSDGSVEFKQVCALLKVEISTDNIAKVIISGTNLAGTATVASATGVVSSVTTGSNSIELTYDGGLFAAGSYFVPILPGTTPAGSFSIELVNNYGATYRKTAPSAVTFVRKEGFRTGDIAGTASYSRHISTKDQLYAWGAVMGEEHDVTVYLDADINCSSDPWTYEDATFDGVFEGQDHKIYNLVVTATSENTGFISRLLGSLKNVTIGSSNGSSWDGVSTITHNGTSSEDSDTRFLGLIGRMVDGSSMIGVNNYAAIVAAATNSRVYIGGLVGTIPASNTATLTNCKNYGSVTNNSTWSGGQTRMGGILGQCDGTLTATGVENHGALTINNNVVNFVGGLCGDLGSGSSVSTSKNYGTISFTDSGTSKTYLGGCFGSVRGSTISGCHNYAAISAVRNAECWFGGIAGFCETGETTISSCTNHTGADLDVASSVTSKSVKMGGITGGCQYNGSGPFGVTVQSCKNEASITNNGGGTHFSGIVGLFDNYYASATLQILSCENTGAVSSTVADNSINFNQELRVGGILGMADPESAGARQTIRSCVNSGNVSINGALNSGASLRIGGIVGHAYNDTSIEQCKNHGTIACVSGGADSGKAVFNLGGVVGYINTRSSSRYQRVIDCINTGTVSSIRNYNNQYLGGIIGGGTNADAYPQVDGCTNYGNISATRTTNTMVGGVCGYTCYTMTNCADFGDISGGQWFGALVGDGNSKAVTTTGNKVGNGVLVGGVAVPVANGTYSYNSSGDLTQRKWFCGGLGYDGTAFTISVVNQETYSE